MPGHSRNPGASKLFTPVPVILYAGDKALIPGSGRSPGEGNGNVPQSSGLENPMDRGAPRASVHGAAEPHTTEHTHAELVFRI